MTVETTPCDSAGFLGSTQAIAAYIEAALEDGDPALVTHALGVVARARHDAAGARRWRNA